MKYTLECERCDELYNSGIGFFYVTLIIKNKEDPTDYIICSRCLLFLKKNNRYEFTYINEIK